MSGTLVDQAVISVKSGNGGNGAATFRREKFVPRGGPDGGDGGDGGNVYIIADASLNTLMHYRHTLHFKAEDGGHGGKRNRYGKQGDDLLIPVPPGTVVRSEIDGTVYHIDLERPGQQVLVAHGGRGGLGNVHFASSSRQAPRISEIGEPGEERRIELELKLIADVALVGFPNAGKSTLLSVISAARPKIADYPFTTIQPHLGVVDVGYDRFVVADVPGIIENAHCGEGLGIEFLRHIERTRLLLHVIDAAGVDGRDPLNDYHQINTELRLYHPELATRPQVVVLNKLDIPTAQEQLPRLQDELPVATDMLFPIAAVTHHNIDALLTRISALLHDIPAPPRQPVELDTPPFTFPTPYVNPDTFTVEHDTHDEQLWHVSGVKIERLITMTNFQQAEALDRVQRVLAASGISNALIEAGIAEGHTVIIAGVPLVWSHEMTYG